MIYPKNWTSLFALVVGVAAVALLFSLRLDALAKSYSQVESFTLSPEREVRLGTRGSEKLADSDAYTTYLPLVSLNAGAAPPLFGVQMYGTVTHTTGLAEVVATGARWIRAPISWKSAEPTNCTPDQYDWGGIDAQVRALVDEGIEPLLTLSDNPSWAATYPMGPVTDVADLQEFMGALVERFDGDGYADAPGSPVVRYWEMYNEPDNTDVGHAVHGGYGYWGRNGDVYAAMLDAIYPVVKAANPRAQVVFGGVAHDNFVDEGGVFARDFVDDVLSSCAGPCFDVMNFHYFPYYRFRWETYGRDVIGKTNYFRAKLASYGLDRPLMCTETTWPSASSWGSATLQPRYVPVAYARGLAAGLMVQNWYAWRDIDSGLPGLLDSGLQPKPAYYAYQTLTAQLGRARYVRPLTAEETGGGNIEGYVFSVPGASTWERLDVVWYDCAGYRRMPPQDCPPGASQTMTVTGPGLRVTDMYGNSNVRYDADDGVVDERIALEIGPNPVYVKYGLRSGAKALSKELVLPGLDIDTVRMDLFQSNAYTYPNCRFGVGAGPDINEYDVTALNLGWYVDWQSTQTPQSPAGLEYVQTIRVSQVGADGWALDSPALDQLTATVQSNPGALWLVGNEPDSPYQDDLVPEAYASAYHDLYYLIKGLDPAAQMAVGGIVQPTPLRFAYLDAVWDAYRQLYGEKMPVDVWNIHTFILRETAWGHTPDPEPCGPNHPIPNGQWGAYIPPGSAALEGELYCVRDLDDIDIFKQRIRAFRQWMADKGEREKPLIVTEYGVLFPEDYSDEDGRRLSADRVGAFMHKTFDFFLSETDPLIGYPYDGNRLVQRWAWFSLSANPNDWGGTLFDPTTKLLRSLGTDFQAYTGGLVPTVDLVVARAFAEPAILWYEDATVTATLKAVVSNVGNISTVLPITVTFYDGPPGEPDSSPIGGVHVITSRLDGCAEYEIVETEWPGLLAGAHSFYVVVENADDDESSNNMSEGLVLVANSRAFLPLVIKSW